MSGQESFPNVEMKSLEKGKQEETQASNISSQPHIEEIVVDIGPNDVLFGRGFQINNNQGNMRYRELLQQRKAEYSATARRQRKDYIAREIVDHIHQKNGRFLQKIEFHCNLSRTSSLAETPLSWKIVDKETAVGKVKQAIRDYSERKRNKTPPSADFGNMTLDNRHETPTTFPRAIQQLPLNSNDNHVHEMSIPHLPSSSSATGHDSLMPRDAVIPGLSLSNSSHQLDQWRQNTSLQRQLSNLSFLSTQQQFQSLQAQQVFQSISATYQNHPSLPSFRQPPSSISRTPFNFNNILELINQNNHHTGAPLVTRNVSPLNNAIAHMSLSIPNQDLVTFFAGLDPEEKAAILSAFMARGDRYS